ncbi:MAG: hypothetical protein ACTHNB_07360 [Gaiellaceae bacterium]
MREATAAAKVGLGAILAHTEIGADAGRVRDLAEGVVELGCDHLLIYDHLREG